MATETATLLAQSTRHELALETQLEAVNNRLKEAKRRVRVVVPSKRHRTLHLRATLPAMPEEVQGPPKRRYIKVEAAYTAQGIEEAEALAIDLNQDINDWRNGRAFDWPKWIRAKKRQRSDELESFASVIERLKTQFFEERKDDPMQQKIRRYWQSDYSSQFAKLNQALPYSVGHMREVIESLRQNSSPRKRLSLACVRLMRLMSEPIDLVEEIKELGRGYGKKSLNPRDIPSDDQILKDIDRIAPEWRWAFQVFFQYGARPHELWEAEVLDNGLLRVSQNTKTGSRVAMPRDRKLVKEWGLFGTGQERLPATFGKKAAHPEQCVSMLFNRARLEAGIQYPAYALRHAWAISSIKKGTNIRLAARSLGHTVSEHESTYLTWITEKEMEDAMVAEAG